MKIFNVLDYGAVPGTGEKMTAQFQAALDACFLAGGGTVEVPAGDYLLGGIRVRSNTVLHLLENAHLFGTRVPEDYCVLDNDTLEPADKAAYPYATNRWNNALIRIFQAENVTILGEPGSCLNGQNCYDPQGEEGYRGPHGITAYYCRNLVFKGYTVRDSANWAHQIRYSSNIVGEDLHVFAGHDGFHTRACQNVEVRNCEFYTGDDAIAGHGNVNVTVTNCILNTACSAFRFGATNLTVDNCTFFGPARYPWRGCLSDEEKINGSNEFSKVPDRLSLLSMFTFFSEDIEDINRDPGHITFKNCKVNGAERLVQFNFSGGDKWQQGKAMTDLTLENITVEGLMMPIVLYGDKDAPCTVTMKHCAIDTADSFSADSLFQIANCRELRMEDVEIRTGAPHLFRSWGGIGRIERKDFRCSIPAEAEMIVADEPFWSLDI